MLEVIKELLLKIVADIDGGNSNISERDSLQLVSLLKSYTDKTIKLSKYQACKYLNMSRASFNDGDIEEILTLLEKYHCCSKSLTRITDNLRKAVVDTGFTYSSYKDKCSVMVVHKASSIGEFINTFEHEKNHLEMHICEALDINPYSEEAAHMSGTLAQTILEKALCSIIEL